MDVTTQITFQSVQAVSKSPQRSVLHQTPRYLITQSKSYGWLLPWLINVCKFVVALSTIGSRTNCNSDLNQKINGENLQWWHQPFDQVLLERMWSRCSCKRLKRSSVQVATRDLHVEAEGRTAFNPHCVQLVGTELPAAACHTTSLMFWTCVE